ncbi:MAG: hypothetical protein A2591_03085 [Candidatus Yonathbacteria bacterium RIFOXYD1_FULL_52_36]|uniref:PAC domain-containing protein n=1 Tax=Candidatus Yonathbacteria bacterium RIFOXYD1_FULL_52_36 TaxID=1802730 RepID=A0A1G2SK45_9BACT|nr:MAG: hypothetical protein A2591_03085 [Candidatus Yonathbacteria bacterium RIFOXYD1_FULL_52_36]
MGTRGGEHVKGEAKYTMHENNILAEEKDLFKILADASPDCIKLFALDNKIKFMSQGGLKEHNLKTPEDAIGLDWTTTIVPEQRDEVLRKIKQSIAEKRAVSIDVQHLHEFSNREWCALIINPIFDESGNVKYFVGISRDISDRKKFEEEIQERSAEQSRLVNAMIDREIKMAELKRENDELRKSLGFPPA